MLRVANLKERKVWWNPEQLTGEQCAKYDQVVCGIGKPVLSSNSAKNIGACLRANALQDVSHSCKVGTPIAIAW